MSLFFYSKGPTMNVIAPLKEIELASVPLASSPYLPGNRMGRWDDVFHVMAQTIATRGKIILTIDAPPGSDGWRHPIAEAPEPFRERAVRALRPFACRFSIEPITLDVELVCC